MSRRNTKPEVHNKLLSPHVLDSAELETKAKVALGAAGFKEAIEYFKELIKRERKSEWVDGLASCYAGRARDLAHKGMVKEALVLWRNRTDLCGKPLVEGFYIELLMLAGDQEQALRLLTQKDLPATLMSELETRMAALSLFSQGEALARLDADSPLLRHRPFALEALAAYQRGDFVAMGAQLQSIPFRSPYRDLRSALKALSLLESNVAEAMVAVERVPANGPFESLIVGIRVAALPANKLLAALHDLDANIQQMVLGLKGYPESQHRLILELARMGDSATPLQMFELIDRYRQAIPETATSGLLRRLLPHVPDRQKFYAAALNKLPQFEREQVRALKAELQGYGESADGYWVNLADTLSAAPGTRLQAGLIMRRMAKAHENHIDDGKLCDEGMSSLKKSVEFDPEDREGYLKLIAVLRAEKDLTAARSYLESALARFPKDARILLAAVETALASKAFKKALGYAKKVLELDPINPKVRTLVGQAHLSHARKLVKSGNIAAARKELDDADEWMRAPTDRLNLKLLRAITHPDIESGAIELCESLAGLGGFLLGSFYLLLEAEQIGYDPNILLRRAEIDLSVTPTAGEVVAFAQALNAGQIDEKILRAAMFQMRNPLKKAANGHFSEADQQMICEVFQRCKETGLVVDYASAALKRWPAHPVFVYLQIAAKYDDNLRRIKREDLKILDLAKEEAHRRGDQRTATRIAELLRNSATPFWMNDFDEDEEDEDDFDDDFQPLPTLNQTGNPREMLEMLFAMQSEKGFLDMARSELGPEIFNEIKQKAGGNNKKLIELLLALLQEAAEQLLPKASAPPPSGRISPLNTPMPKQPEPAKKSSKPSLINPNQKSLFDD